jgi:hypothetical protein
MFQRIRHYNLIDVSDRFYRPRAYGDPRADGTWDGWLVFFPLDGGPAVATDRETTQATFEALTVWAAGLTPVYLEGALARALILAHQPSVIDQLEDAEYEALEDADELEMAAAEARAGAERIRRERVVTESALAATEEVAATEVAERHEEAAREARAVAADAARRNRRPLADTTPMAGPKKPRGARKSSAKK